MPISEDVQYTKHAGTNTGRWSCGRGRKTHTVYPKQVMLAVGTLGKGIDFYGPFDDGLIAMKWAGDNLHTGADVRLEILYNVRDGA